LAIQVTSRITGHLYPTMHAGSTQHCGATQEELEVLWRLHAIKLRNMHHDANKSSSFLSRKFSTNCFTKKTTEKKRGTFSNLALQLVVNDLLYVTRGDYCHIKVPDRSTRQLQLFLRCRFYCNMFRLMYKSLHQAARYQQELQLQSNDNTRQLQLFLRRGIYCNMFRLL